MDGNPQKAAKGHFHCISQVPCFTVFHMPALTGIMATEILACSELQDWAIRELKRFVKEQ